MVSPPLFQSMEALCLLLFLSVKMWYIKIPHTIWIALDESKQSIWVFLLKNKKGSHKGGWKHVLSGDFEQTDTSQRHRMLCRWWGVTSEQFVLVHWSPLWLFRTEAKFRPVHDLRACPTSLVNRVEKSSYWVTEQHSVCVWAEVVPGFLFMGFVGMWPERHTFLTMSYRVKEREGQRLIYSCEKLVPPKYSASPCHRHYLIY